MVLRADELRKVHRTRYLYIALCLSSLVWQVAFVEVYLAPHMDYVTSRGTVPDASMLWAVLAFLLVMLALNLTMTLLMMRVGTRLGERSAWGVVTGLLFTMIPLLGIVPVMVFDGIAYTKLKKTRPGAAEVNLPQNA